MLVQTSTIQDIDRSIQRKQMEIRALEQAKSVLTTSEPMAASATATQTQTKRGPGRPRKAGTQTRSAAGKKGPGRPRGRKASGKKRGPGRPKGSKNKPKAPEAPAITPGASNDSLWANDGTQQ